MEISSEPFLDGSTGIASPCYVPTHWDGLQSEIDQLNQRVDDLFHSADMHGGEAIKDAALAGFSATHGTIGVIAAVLETESALEHIKEGVHDYLEARKLQELIESYEKEIEAHEKELELCDSWDRSY